MGLEGWKLGSRSVGRFWTFGHRGLSRLFAVVILGLVLNIRTFLFAISLLSAALTS